MDWTSIIIALIGAGGVTGLFLITERKTAAALKNMETMYNILKGQYEDLLSRDNEKDKKIDSLYDKIGTLHVEKDAATTIAEIDAAIAAGKAVMCYFGDRPHHLSSTSGMYYYFSSLATTGNSWLRVVVSTSVWEYGSMVLENTNYKKTTISGNESSNTYYPTTKAVADALANYVQKSQSNRFYAGDGNGYLTYG